MRAGAELEDHRCEAQPFDRSARGTALGVELLEGRAHKDVQPLVGVRMPGWGSSMATPLTHPRATGPVDHVAIVGRNMAPVQHLTGGRTG